MGFLVANVSENLAGRITNKGRKKIAQGNFNITYFQVGDSEYDYTLPFYEFNGDENPGQKVLMPFDKDSQVKYPYKYSESSISGTTYGTPVQSVQMDRITNYLSAVGFVSDYNESTINSTYEPINISRINGSNILSVSNGTLYYNVEFITILFGDLGIGGTISENVHSSLTYKIIDIVNDNLHLDRPMPNLSFLSGDVTIVSNALSSFNPCIDQEYSWDLNTVWSKTPAGLDPAIVPLTTFDSNVFVSAKEYFGYNTSSGQTDNTLTTITNTFGNKIIVPPEEQHSISILHYSKVGVASLDPDLPYKYEDYIGHNEDETEYFEIYIPFILYDRNTTTTIGARFFMDTEDFYINSTAIDTRPNQMKFRYLIDEQGVKVGKVFVNHKVIIFDDQEIVAALDYKSNRNYTLPIPQISTIPIDSKCDDYGNSLIPLLSGGTTGQTVFVTYLLQHQASGDSQLSGMCCNYYSKISNSIVDSDVSIKFDTDDFQFMRSTFSDVTNGYIADTFQILVQVVNTGEQPDPTLWKIIDFTDQIPNHTPGTLINPTTLRDTRFIITSYDYENAGLYVIPETHFGDFQSFPGSIKVARVTDMEVMRFLVNLPSGYFETTQNPSYDTTAIPAIPKRITEVALLDENKDVLVIAKASSPIEKVGTIVLAVQLDI